MTPPVLLFSRFLSACLLGGGLGIFYDLFTPLPRIVRHFTDALFVFALFACGIYLGFGICEGDLRPAYSAGLFVGFFLWRNTLGRLLRPLLSMLFGFAQGVFGKFWVLCRKISKNISGFCKKTFAIVKK
ncbi:MAG: hypothetical protein IJD63_02215 [Oscillospiraceae bacterium]|nr:hypothetical protein [Oscillospiraceae bacterium]